MASDKISKKFTLLPVVVKDLTGSLTVKPIIGREIVVEIEGDKEAVAGVIAEIREAKLYISGGPKKKQTVINLKSEDEDGESSSTLVIEGGVSDTTIFNMSGGGNFSLISISQRVDPINVTVHIPQGLSLEVANVSGEVTIGDIECSLNIKPQGEHTEIGSITALDVDVSSNKTANIKRVNGAVIAKVGSNGTLTIGEGIATSLEVKMSSNSLFDFGGTAYNAEAQNASGSVFGVKRALGRSLSLQIASNAHASVGSGEVAKLTANAASNANITFDGKATDAELNLSSNATITVDQVVNTPVVNKGSNATVIIRKR